MDLMERVEYYNNQMSGVQHYNIEQIPNIEQNTRIITIGTILSIDKQQKFISFYISDTTATAEATFYQKKSGYELIQLPQFGDAIQVLGTCLTKPLADKKKLFLKIRLERWRIISFQEQIQFMQTIQSSRKRRYQKKIKDQMVEIRKIVPMKEKNFNEQEIVDIRSIIFMYTYTVFKSNKDISTLLFAVLMVRKHSVCNDYAKENNITCKSMEEGLKQGLTYLLENGIIQQRLPKLEQISLNHPEQYAIRRRYFELLSVDIEKFVYEKRAKGTTLEYVTKAMNENMGKYKIEDWLFNWRFVQKVLIDLINEFRIYKTSEKRLFPYNQ